MTGYGGFKWPESGPVEAPDWEPTYECGHGLHGLPWGVGGSEYLNWDEEAKWLVVEAKDDEVLTGQGDLTAKCKFPRGNVVYCGERKGATDYILDNGGEGKPVVGAIREGGDRSTITSGSLSTITSGDRSTITSGSLSTIASGDGSTITSGNLSTITGGEGSTINIQWWDKKSNRWRITIGYVGEDGIEANVPYRCDDNGKLIKVEV